VMDDTTLTWPRRFETYERCRVLRDVTDILGALDSAHL
jgi:hypothetical protein